MKLAEPKSIRWTREEYYKMAVSGLFDGRRVELIHGEIFEMSPQDSLHASGITMVNRCLSRNFTQSFLVRVQLPVALGLESDPEPDFAIVQGEVSDYLQAHPSTAVLVIEVSVSSLEYDRTIKLQLYAEAGIPEYWIINLVDRRLEVYRQPQKSSSDPNSVDYGWRQVLTAQDSISPLSLPQASIPVAELLP